MLTDSALILESNPSLVLVNVSDLVNFENAGLGSSFGAGEWKELELANAELAKRMSVGGGVR